MKDARGLEVSTNSVAAIEAADHFADQIVAMGLAADQVLAAADQHADCVLLQEYAAALHLFALADENDALAETYLARARALQEGANQRERLLLELLEEWAGRRYESAIDRAEEITRRWPRDLVTAKIAEFLYYVTGQAYQALRFLAHMERIAPENGDSSHFLAMHAFALELAGRRAEARAMAERAVEMRRCTPWAHHCLAHVYLEEGDLERGEATLRDLAPTWPECGRIVHGHNQWHLALFPLSRLELDEALRLYHADVWGFLPDAGPEQVDAISFLWRVELAGRTLDDEWLPIVPHLESRAEQCFFPFGSAHTVYALARAGRSDALEASLSAARSFAARQAGARRRVWIDVGLPLLEACAAFATGDAMRSAVLLEPIVEKIGCAGGSDAQDELFLQTYLVALIRAGRREQGRRFLDRLRGTRDVGTPLEAAWEALL